jgi:hypothetical protein
VRDEAVRILDQLLGLYCQTDPRHGPEGKSGKYNLAFLALKHAGVLTRLLTNWAENHIRGALDRFNHTPRGEDFDWDSHANELQVLDKDVLLGPEQSRWYMAALLESSCCTRRGWRMLLSDGLRALNHGEVQPLIRPSPTKKHGRRFTLLKLQRVAVLHVHALRGSGVKKYAAEERIADELAVSIDTLRSWEKQFLRDDKKFKQTLSLARTIAPHGLDQLQHAEERLWERYGKSDDFTPATRLHDELRKHPLKDLARKLREAKAR